MLSDSKVRQAGFIRNSSSRKIIYHPQPQKQSRDNSDDDSFSSFQYQGPTKISLSSKEKTQIIINQREKRQQLIITKALRPPTAKIPPKPTKKQQPQFQNQRLKNNFFQQPITQPIVQLIPQPKSKQKPQYHPQNITTSLPRSRTPQFPDSAQILNHNIEQPQNICNRLGNMKVLEGNFSFNPKVNRPKKEVDLKEHIYLAENNMNHGERVKEDGKKSKVNNYFSEAQNNKFQYDLQSSDESQQEEQQNHKDSFSQGESQHMDNEMMQYYRQQQRQRTLPEAARTQQEAARTQQEGRKTQQLGRKTPQEATKTKTQSRDKHPQTTNQIRSQGQIYNPQQKHHPKTQKIQNQQSQNNQQEELITDYNKTDFGIGMAQQLRRNKRSKQSMTAQVQQQNLIQTHGGISFEVDVKQFSHTPQKVSYQPIRRSYQQKKKKVNQKEEMLKRREMAKTYSKQARFRLFGFS